MKLQRTVFFLLLIFVCFVFAGCRSVPYSGRKQMLFTSEETEKKLGEEAWQSILKEEKVEKDPFYTTALLRVGNRLATAVDEPNMEWEFKVFDSKTPNAFCLPGGKVAVYKGLFKYIDNDAELAAIVGHEIAHAVARHGGERMTQAMLKNIGGAAVAAATGGEAIWQMAYGYGTEYLGMLPYSRKHEAEADYLGLLFMAKAGYDPNAALTFWEKFSELSNISTLGEFFSTHPAGKNRIEDIKKDLPEAMKLYKQQANKYGLGKTDYFYKN